MSALTQWQAFAFGIMVAYAPALLVLTWMVWRAPRLDGEVRR